MRPGRDDIAAPELPRGIAWVGSRPLPMARLTAAGPVLVHVFDFAQLNSVRTLPYVEGWHRRYRDAGLSVLGVQAPRFPFGAEEAAVAAGLARLGVSFPTAVDAGREIWTAYGCEGWPSLFLWGRGGTLRWFHFGEGEYRASEEAIRAELPDADRLSLPAPMHPLRPTDKPGATVIAPTGELFPARGRPWTASREERGFVVDYEGGGVAVTAEGQGELYPRIDGKSLPPLSISGAGLYTVAEHPHHERHSLTLDVGDGVGVWSVSFSAGVPSAGEFGPERVGAVG